jgi:hypothetical protein
MNDGPTTNTGTGTSTATNTTGTVTTGTNTVPSEVCAGAKAIMQANGTDSGFVLCPDGTVHRAAKMACDPAVTDAACGGTEDYKDCLVDSDCNAGPHGKCVSYDYEWDPSSYCGCVYPCVDDSDCGAGNVCVCDGAAEDDVGMARCAQAQCTVGSDCPSGECGVSSYYDGCGYNVGLACRAPGDACRTDSECVQQGFSDCALPYGSGDWMCTFQDCAIGRPMLVDGRARTARAEERDDWCATLALDVSDLDADERAALAEHWQRVAALEHASVASFARFSLQLMALGAPPALLRDAQQAASDEIEHARFAYAIASAYAGRRLGPGPLCLSGVPLHTDRKNVMLELVAEACVGETLGVAEAHELARIATDPSLQQVHARIAADEQRHAELAWRALGWMLDGADAALRAEVRRAFAVAAASAQADPADPRAVVPAHGLASGASIGALRRQALREVVLPCAAQLLAA